MNDIKSLFQKYNIGVKKSLAYLWFYGRGLPLLAPLIFTFWYAHEVGNTDISEVNNVFYQFLLVVGLIEYALGIIGIGYKIFWWLIRAYLFINEWAKDQFDTIE